MIPIIGDDCGDCLCLYNCFITTTYTILNDCDDSSNSK